MYVALSWFIFMWQTSQEEGTFLVDSLDNRTDHSDLYN